MVTAFGGARAQIHHTDTLSARVRGRRCPHGTACGWNANGALAGRLRPSLRTPPPDPHQISVRERGRWGLSPSINSGDTRHFSAVIRARFPTLYLDHLRGCAHEMQTHSILGDVETKGEKASVREVAVGRLHWKTATVQVAGSWNSSLCVCAKARPGLCLLPQEGHRAAGAETRVMGSDTARDGRKMSLSHPRASPRVLPFLIFTGFFHHVTSFLRTQQWLPVASTGSKNQLQP